jgi:hypothetical protein
VALIGLTAFLFLYTSTEERTGQIASLLRCHDPGCQDMTVEEAVMSDTFPRRTESYSYRYRYPLANHSWNAIWLGLYHEGRSAVAIRASPAEKYGARILLPD